jgi:hypothetical protein
VGSRKPDGSAAKTERVTFTRPAAERIAKVVRRIESGSRDSTGPKFLARDGAGGSSGKPFRVCTYSGDWPVGSSKTVTFKYATTTPNTVSATNLFLPLPENGTRDCAVARDGTAWFLVQAQMELAHAFTAATLTTSSIEFNTLPVVAFASASTNKFTLTPPTESVIVGASLGTASLEFSRKNVGVFFASTAGTVAVSVTTCSTAAA